MVPSPPIAELPRSLRNRAGVCHAVFCDFDETYLAHDPSPAQRATLTELEDYLDGYDRCGLLFGWVTGSSLTSVLAKVSRHGLGLLPHFVASSLGTELTFFDDGRARPDDGWAALIRRCGFDRELAERAVATLSVRDVVLFPQPSNGSDVIANYYYRIRGDTRDGEALRLIAATARSRGLGLNLSRCNPLAGDPEDCYDVDFFPEACGKRNIVRYISDRFAVAGGNTVAFGDSGNDLEMLAEVGYGVLVANCTDEARAQHTTVSERPYAEGVLSTLGRCLHPGSA